MKWITLGAVLALAWILCPALVLALVANPLVVAFALGFALRPAIGRRIRGWAT